MKVANKKLLNLMQTLALAYPKQQLNENNIKVYIEFLAKYPYDLLEQAIHEHIQQEDWFPTIAQLARKVQEMQEINLALDFYVVEDDS